jgi:hypothetical protein
MFDTSHLEASSAPCRTLLTQFPLAFCDLTTLQREDPELLQVIEKLERKVQDSNFFLVNGVLHALPSPSLLFLVPRIEDDCLLRPIACGFGLLTVNI